MGTAERCIINLLGHEAVLLPHIPGDAEPHAQDPTPEAPRIQHVPNCAAAAAPWRCSERLALSVRFALVVLVLRCT